MGRAEHDLRELFRRLERGSPLLEPGEPERVARRTRRRQVANVAASAVALVALVVGATVVTRGLGHRETTPARPVPPGEAPVVVRRGSVDGWDWVLSASEDGTCVALTDVQGSTVLCPTPEEIAALGEPESRDLIGVTVRHPRPPGPDSAFVFGIVSPRTTAIRWRVQTQISNGPAEEAIFRSPPRIEGDRGFFLARFDGYPYPVVPEVSVLAIGDEPLDRTAVELPDWARPPRTVLEVVATGTWGALGEHRRWTVQVWRDELTGEMCYGVDLEGVCGPPAHPVPRWSPSRSIRRVTTSSVIQTLPQGERRSTFVWGLFDDPIVDLRVELGDGRTLEPEIYGPPSSYPDAPRVFLFQYRSKTTAAVIGLDADGEIVATA